ncbi:hypothetical protein BGW38_003908 [Lunasporangiospora selenospora]|uniref:Phosphodiesterase n=1 Tax=Lunasporangiospora selenospora TaxID=979761 RepID=A0A9P6FR79_9FUNG|nr:hypothetical protein BGW38_003908 [Lunasporangiospora selenospora]
MLLLRHCRLSSEDLITCERALLRFTAGRAKGVDLNFNVWDYTVPEIYGYTLGMFTNLGLVECLGLTSGELLDFIVDVDRGYLSTFYHSFYHAADVTAVLYHMLQGMHASQFLTKPDMAALLLAGLCHDIGHPGLNNLFQVNANTDLFKRFGEASVLEKYSCSLAMELVTKHALFRNISKSECSRLPEGQPATEESMRESMVQAILATDMTFHYDMLNNLNNLIEAVSSPVLTSGSSDSGSESDSEPDSDSDEDVISVDCSPPSCTTPNESPILSKALNSPQTTRIVTEKTEIVDSGRLAPPSSAPLAKLAQAQRKSVSIVTPVIHADDHDTDSTTGSQEPSPVESRVPARFQSLRLGRGRRSSCSSTSSQESSASNASMPSATSLECLSAADFTPEQRQNLCNCLLHAADISNAVKPWIVSKRWSDLVVQEFFRQGDIEKAQGLPVSPNMDRKQHNQPQISLGFGDFVVQPYFESFVEFLPAATPILKTLSVNRDHWLALQKAALQFANDPYLSVDPLEDPSNIRRPSSPLMPSLASGRRVSVAAGVLVLDDTIPLRTPRRLRHSTNTELSPGHMLRRMRRSLSGRSLSSSLLNLNIHGNHPRSHSIKSAQSQETLSSSLRRTASLLISNEAMASSTSLNNMMGATLPGWSNDSANSQHHGSISSVNNNENEGPASATDKNHKSKDSVSSLQSWPTKEERNGLVGGGSFRQKRLASLQVSNSDLATVRQGFFGDGYSMPQSPLHINSDQRSEPTLGPLQEQGPLGDEKASTAPSTATVPSSNNRSSTPAVMMMGRTRFDNQLPPTLMEPVQHRTGCGPLDSVQEMAMATTDVKEHNERDVGLKSLVTSPELDQPKWVPSLEMHTSVSAPAALNAFAAIMAEKSGAQKEGVEEKKGVMGDPRELPDTMERTTKDGTTARATATRASCPSDAVKIVKEGRVGVVVKSAEEEGKPKPEKMSTRFSDGAVAISAASRSQQ